MKSHVSMETAVCPACGREEETGCILLHQKLEPVLERHTATGWKLCKEHQDMVDSGFVVMVAVDPERSRIKNDQILPEDAYRTGPIIGLNREAWERIFNRPAPEGGLAFVEEEVIHRITGKVEKGEAGDGSSPQ